MGCTQCSGPERRLPSGAAPGRQASPPAHREGAASKLLRSSAPRGGGSTFRRQREPHGRLAPAAACSKDAGGGTNRCRQLWRRACFGAPGTLPSAEQRTMQRTRRRGRSNAAAACSLPVAAPSLSHSHGAATCGDSAGELGARRPCGAAGYKEPLCAGAESLGAARIATRRGARRREPPRRGVPRQGAPRRGVLRHG